MKWRIVEHGTCEDGEITITEERGNCEHCGDREHGQASFCDGGTWWCDCCMDCIWDNPPSKKILAEVEAKEKEVKRAYHQKQLDSL
ncbi:hypothetical protein LCGC14_2196230 [marine sediment metagenome]|uniref:Uncharacterized protein n=1 Tax=marine sediment metagenome TaxID=412755 RepID=A0A0F9GDW1_9ZZZZ